MEVEVEVAKEEAIGVVVVAVVVVATAIQANNSTFNVRLLATSVVGREGMNAMTRPEPAVL